MHIAQYPQGTVRELLNTDLVLPQTKAALEKRLENNEVTQPSFFTDTEFETLKAICKRLIPQEEHEPIDLPGLLDTDLGLNRGNGWRYDTMPPDQESFKLGIAGFNEVALSTEGKSFTDLSAEQQDTIIRAVQNSNVTGKAWHNMPSELFFEELLSRLCEYYYAHPLAKETIGDVSFADAHGWEKIKLNEKEPQEILPL